jgi:hypothetical protein
VDRYELRSALLAAGLPPESFQLTDVHEHTPIPTDFWFLRPATGGRWEIGAYERGGYEVRETFDTEGAAGARLYEILTGR